MSKLIISILENYWFWGSIGFSIGGALCFRNMVKNGCPFPTAVISVNVGIYGGLLGTRILYVLIFYPQLFADSLPIALAFWRETGTWLGGPIGGAIGVFIALKIAKQPFWSNLGSVAPGLALAHAFCRIGCIYTGCCFGAPSTVPWAIHSRALGTMTHPTQIYSMIGEIISFLLLQKLWKNKDLRIYLYPMYGIFLSFHRFISEFFRGSEEGPEIIPGLRVFQTVCVCIFVVSLFAIVFIYRNKNSKQN